MQVKIRKERLSELMKDFEIAMYRVKTKSVRPPKCSKCNEERKIEYKTHLGKITYEYCDCNNAFYVYYPEEYIYSEFRINRDKNGISAWYKINPSKYDEKYGKYVPIENSTLAKVFYHEEMEHGDLSCYDTFFKTEEECQLHCDYLNANNK